MADDERLLFVRVADRPGSLERLLGLVRRKAMKVTPASIGRVGLERDWAVVMSSTEPDAPLERYGREIRHLVDVREVSPIGRAGSAEGIDTTGERP